MAKKNSPSFKYSDDELSNLINEADAEKARQPVSFAGAYDDASVPSTASIISGPDDGTPNRLGKGEIKGTSPLSRATKKEQLRAGNIVSDIALSAEDYDNTLPGVSESEYGKVRIGEKGSLIGGAGGSDAGRAPYYDPGRVDAASIGQVDETRIPYYEPGKMDPIGGQSRSPLSFSPAMGGEIKSYTGEGSVLSDEINSMNSMSDEKMAQRAAARGVVPQAKAGQQVLSGTGPLFAPAGGSKVGLSGMLSSGKVGRNAIAGAVVGAVAGGLNPAGDDGLFRGAAGGAAVGAVMGGLAGAVNAQMNPKGSETVSKGGRLFPGPMKDGAPPKIGRAGMLMSVGGVVGGLMGGLLGGSGRGKRHNTIDSNGWSKGTHPAYF